MNFLAYVSERSHVLSMADFQFFVSLNKGDLPTLWKSNESIANLLSPALEMNIHSRNVELKNVYMLVNNHPYAYNSLTSVNTCTLLANCLLFQKGWNQISTTSERILFLPLAVWWCNNSSCKWNPKIFYQRLTNISDSGFGSSFSSNPK